jgi:transcriptional regulator with XRE-family HTH domain
MNPMTRLAERVGREPFFLGYQLAQLRQEYGQTIEEQAAAFGLDLDLWSRLALCRMPATMEDLAKIAARFGLEPDRLAELLQVDLGG